MNNKKASITVDVYSDVICPWCYIGKTRLDEAIQMLGDDVEVKVDWKPYQLNAAMPTQGMDRQEYLIRKFGTTNVSEMQGQLNKAGLAYGVRIDFNQIKRVPNTFKAHRLLRWAKKFNLQQTLLAILFRRFFNYGQDLGNTDVLVACASEAGLPTDAVIKFLHSNECEPEVHEEEENGVEMGISMVPTFVVDDQIIGEGTKSSDELANLLKKAASGRARKY
jgi:predicted DsbA family dithiol-disulfide isomerase